MRRRLRGGDARSDAYGLTDTPQNTALFALNIGMAIANPITGIPMLAAPIIYSALSEVADADEKAREANYDKTFRARDEYQQAEARRRSQAHFSKYEAAHELYLMRQSIVPVLLTEADVDRNIADQEKNIAVSVSNLDSYNRLYTQNMINNNRALQQNRQAALIEQSRQRVSTVQAQTAALQSTRAARTEAARLEQQQYMNAIASQKDLMRQKAQNYQDNLAKSQNTLSTQQSIVQQNQLANQRAQEQAAQIAAARAAQAAPTQAPPRVASRLPPPVLLPRR